MKVSIEKPQSNMCYGCEVYCCTLLVELTSYDIFRIAIEQVKDPDDFVDVLFAEPGDLNVFRANGIMVKLALKHKGKYCVFFDREAKLKCTIDKSKPSLCLAYPFSSGGSILSDALCPKENLKKAHSAKMSPEALADCKWELDRYIEIVQDWNMLSDGSQSVNDFLRFAAAEMTRESSPAGSIYRKARRAIIKKVFQDLSGASPRRPQAGLRG
jgi:Fe-S-cluster containining protein